MIISKKNPFEPYVYSSYYASLYVEEKTDEWYMIPDAENDIAQVKSGGAGFIMLGHAYWDRAFSKRCANFEEDRNIGKYDDAFGRIFLQKTSMRFLR